MSDDLKGKINQLLEAKPRLSFNNDGCDVLDKGGNCVRSFKQKDLGEKYRKSAEVFLAQNYSKLNAEGFVWEEKEDPEMCECSCDCGKAICESCGKPKMEKDIREAAEAEMPSKAHIQKMCDDGKSAKEIRKMHPDCDQDKLKVMIDDCSTQKEGMVDAIKSKLHPSRPERNAASRRQGQEAAAKKAVKVAVASTVAKSLKKNQDLQKENVDDTDNEIETQVETPMTNMERLAGFISAQTKVQSADGTSMMGVKKDIQEKKMSKAEFKDMMAGKGKKDKGDMDGDGKHESDDKEYMDNKDKAIKMSMGKKKKDQKDMEEAIDQSSTDPEKTIGHNCATHVEHAVFGSGECIPGMYTLEETSEGEGVVTHYDVMFKIDDQHVVKEMMRVEELKIVKEMHHGHKKKKKK
jgi:hypothetical protein